LRERVSRFVATLGEGTPHEAALAEFHDSDNDPSGPIEAFRLFTADAQKHWNEATAGIAGVVDFHAHILQPFAEQSRSLIAALDHAFKLVSRTIALCEKEFAARDSEAWSSRDISKARKAADAARHAAVERLKQVRHFQRA